ncbi:MAG: LD-carboxypeptidase [Balneolaceae bacterium]|nr:LD-carboxypeptidase [Balneolaceae bacterium]
MHFSRSHFLKLLGLGGLAGYLAPSAILRPSGLDTVLKPPRLERGDTVGLVSPASILPESNRYDEINSTIRSLGFTIKEGGNARGQYGYFAGRDERRAEDLNAMFADPEVDAIIPYRGGWGSNRILELIDYEVIRRNPKPLIGFSDITSLLLAIHARTGLVTFHGPVGKSNWSEFTAGHFEMAVMQGRPFRLESGTEPNEEGTHRVIRKGTADGKLLGGNLSVITSMLGSAYLPKWEGAILFLEDVGEQHYRIDRMLTQLKLSGVLDQLSGFVFGRCTNCQPANDYSLSLDQIFEDHIKPLKIPAFSGTMIGHIDDMFTVPVGVRAKMDATMGEIQILESPVR